LRTKAIRPAAWRERPDWGVARLSDLGWTESEPAPTGITILEGQPMISGPSENRGL